MSQTCPRPAGFSTRLLFLTFLSFEVTEKSEEVCHWVSRSDKQAGREQKQDTVILRPMYRVMTQFWSAYQNWVEENRDWWERLNLYRDNYYVLQVKPSKSEMWQDWETRLAEVNSVLVLK